MSELERQIEGAQRSVHDDCIDRKRHINGAQAKVRYLARTTAVTGGSRKYYAMPII